jgi:hypothetical protein
MTRAARPRLSSGGAVVLTERSLPSIDLWLVYPEGQKPSAQGSAFAAFVEAELNQACSALE